MEIASFVPTGAGVTYYAGRLAQLYRLRRLRGIGITLQADALDPPDGEAETVIERAMISLVGLRMEGAAVEVQSPEAVVKQSLIDIKDRVARGQTLRGPSTGLAGLDKILHGLQPGNLYIVAGVTSSGKSTLAANIGFSVAENTGKRVAYFSLEMLAEELSMRQVAAWAEVDSDAIYAADSRAYNTAFHAAVKRVSAAPVLIHDSAGITIDAIQALCRGYATSREGLGLVIVDYLQLFRAPPGSGRHSREEYVASVSRELKRLAMDLAVPVIACAQLNRGAVTRDDHVPRLGDLRESGAIEQDANVIVFVHRACIFKPELSPVDARLVVAKNRGGATGQCAVHFSGAQSRFSDVAKWDAPY